MQLAEFLNALRIMLSIDQDELIAAGVIPAGDWMAWRRFRSDPFRWFIRDADDEAASKLWALIERRQGPVICPQCKGERRVGGALCDRCNGDAQISRDRLRPGESGAFEAHRIDERAAP